MNIEEITKRSRNGWKEYFSWRSAEIEKIRDFILPKRENFTKEQSPNNTDK